MKHLPIKQGIELAPVVDVVFLLLTTFLLSASVGRYSVLDLQLPPAGSGRQSTKTSIDLRLAQDGRVTINGRAMLAGEVRPTLERLSQKLSPERTTVRLAADGRAPYRSVLMLLDTLRALQLTHLELVAEAR